MSNKIGFTTELYVQKFDNLNQLNNAIEECIDNIHNIEKRLLLFTLRNNSLEYDDILVEFNDMLSAYEEEQIELHHLYLYKDYVNENGFEKEEI